LLPGRGSWGVEEQGQHPIKDSGVWAEGCLAPTKESEAPEKGRTEYPRP
jgi:hypothetical protein